MTIDKETADRIDQPVDEEAEQEIRLTPTEAIERMKINVPVRGNRKLRALIERVNEDKKLKAWWHVANVNAVARMEINDHSWVHIQIVTNISLKLLRQLTKHHVEPAVVRGRVSMHSLSAAAIEDVTITDGEERPILIEIRMNNSSGLFQVDGLLKAKLRGSGLEPYVEVVAHIDTETEQRLVPMYRLEV